MTMFFSSVTAMLIVNLTITGALLWLGVALLCRSTRRIHPRVRYVIAVTAFLAAALLPFVNVRPPNAVAAGAAAVIEVPQADLLAAIWIAGAFLLVARDLAGYRQLRARARDWQLAGSELRARIHWPAHVPLYVSAIEGPFVVGWIRPRVVVRADAADDIARHELDHVRWRDPLVHAVLRLLRAVLWVSIPLWLLERVARREREASADFAAVAADPRPHRVAALCYAESLLAAARVNGQSTRFSATHFGRSSELADRITRVLELPRAISAANVFVAGSLATLCVLAIPFLPTANIAPIALSPPRDRLETISNTAHRAALREIAAHRGEIRRRAHQEALAALRQH